MVLLWEHQFSLWCPLLCLTTNHLLPLKPSQCPLHPLPQPIPEWTGMSSLLPQDRLLHPSVILGSDMIPEHEDAMANSFGAEQLMGARLEGSAGKGK